MRPLSVTVTNWVQLSAALIPIQTTHERDRDEHDPRERPRATGTVVCRLHGTGGIPVTSDGPPPGLNAPSLTCP